MFAYSLQSFSGAAGAVQVSSSTGAITIPAVSVVGLGTFTLVVEGKLQDCLTGSATFTLTCYSNVAPTYSGISTLALPDQTVVQMATLDYALPAVVDPNAW